MTELYINELTAFNIIISTSNNQGKDDNVAQQHHTYGCDESGVKGGRIL